MEGSVATVTADGAYDSDAVYQAAARQHGPPPDVVISPRASAVQSTEDPAAQTLRDRHIRLIAERGRMGWQQATGYGRRNLPRFNWSSQRPSEPFAGVRQRPRRVFSSQGSCEAWC